MIQVKDLRKQFHGKPAVTQISFEAPDGTITGLLGPNGAGKSTTLRMISGVLQPDAGCIRIDDLRVSGDAIARRVSLGALLDHAGLYARLTVREHLVYYGRLRGMPQALLNERVPESCCRFSACSRSPARGRPACLRASV